MMITEDERRQVEDYVMRGVPVGRSSPCLCDDCINRIWRPVMMLTRWTGWPAPAPEPPPHFFAGEQPTRRYCLLFLGRDRVCGREANDPVHASVPDGA